MIRIWNWISHLFEKHFWVDKFPEDRPAECFNCSAISCINCEILHKWRNK